MDSNVEGFLEESAGVNGDAPWDQSEGKIHYLGPGEGALTAAYFDAVKGAEAGQATIVNLSRKLLKEQETVAALQEQKEALRELLDAARTKVSVKAYLVMDLTKELEGLRQENQNLRDELERAYEL